MSQNNNVENLINNITNDSNNPYFRNNQLCLNLASIRGKIQFAKAMLTEAEYMADLIRVNPSDIKCNVPSESLDAFAQSLEAALYEIQQSFNMIKLNSLQVKSK